jgi:hypothetical protein
MASMIVFIFYLHHRKTIMPKKGKGSQPPQHKAAGQSQNKAAGQSQSKAAGPSQRKATGPSQSKTTAAQPTKATAKPWDQGSFKRAQSGAGDIQKGGHLAKVQSRLARESNAGSGPSR